MGDEVPGRELRDQSIGRVGDATGDVEVFHDQASLTAWWESAWPSDAPEVDFEERQAVGFVDYESGCGGGASIDGFSWSAREEGTLVARIRVSCGDRCDEGGGCRWQVWGTPIASVTVCDFGSICE